MTLPQPTLYWQKAAQPGRAAVLSIASESRAAHLSVRAAFQSVAAYLRPDCYPSLRTGLDLLQVGPPLRAECAEPCQGTKSPFAKVVKMADPCLTTISTRGSKSCTKHSQHWPFWPSSPVATARSIPTVPHLARSVVRPLAPLRTTTSRKARSRVVCLALSPVTRAIAADLTPHICEPRTIGASAPVVFSFSRPTEGATDFRGGRRCSRRS